MKYIKTFPRAGYWITVIFVLFITQNLHSQDEWTEPIPLTDSLTNNTNPDISRIHFNQQAHLFMAWEKSNDSSSTAIYFKDLIGQEGEIELLSDENIHYTHPKIFQLYDYLHPDTIFFLFYESDQNNNIDIYYLVYDLEGNFSDPVPFSVSTYDDKELGYNEDGEIVWIIDTDLIYTNYDPYSGSFSDHIVLDTAVCSSPQINYCNFLMWERKTDTIAHIYGAHMSLSDSLFEPKLIYDNGYAVNLSKDVLDCNFYTWSAFVDTSWKMIVYSAYWDDCDEINLVQEKPFDPAITTLIIGLKSISDDLPFFISTPHLINELDEIIINQDPFDYWQPFINLSNSGTFNRNPNFFYGEPSSGSYNCWFNYNVWESFVNNHWQLYHSKTIMCLDGIEEELGQQQFIHISPNPSKSKVNINYSLENNSLVNIEIYDLYGKIIATVFDSNQYKGEQNIKWSFPAELPSGIYFIILRKDDERYSQKIIKSD